MAETVFLAFSLVSKSPPAIIGGDVQGVVNFDMRGFSGPLCEFDVDGDGSGEAFFIVEATGWQDDWVGDRWVAHGTIFKRIMKAHGPDTAEVAHYSFPINDDPGACFASVGFLEANGDGVMDMAVALWNEGFSCLIVYDLSGFEPGRNREITVLWPNMIWASYEIAWPVVRVNGPDGKRGYAWKEGKWVEAE